MAIVYEKTKGLTDVELHYCPGCTHGIVHKLVAETLEEMGVLGQTIGVAPVGCSVFAYKQIIATLYPIHNPFRPLCNMGTQPEKCYISCNSVWILRYCSSDSNMLTFIYLFYIKWKSGLH